MTAFGRTAEIDLPTLHVADAPRADIITANWVISGVALNKDMGNAM